MLMRLFVKLSSSLVISLKIFTVSSDKLARKRNIDYFFGDTLRKLILLQLWKIQQTNSGNMILFQIKVFGRNIKETTLAWYFIKVTARPSFTRLRVIRGKNKIRKISK